MPLPPKGDPQRPLYLAIRSMRLLGIVLIALSLLITAPFMYGMRAGYVPIMVIAIGLFFLLPGTLYFLCAIYLKRRSAWAIMLGIVLASIHLLLTLLEAFVFAAVFMRNPTDVPIQLIVFSLLVIALAQLIYHLYKSFGAIKYSPPEFQRGFEPIVQPQVTDLPRQQ